MRALVALVILLGSSTIYAQHTKKIDAVMKAWTGKTPGCAVAVIQNGKIAHAKGYGMADLERGVSISPETVFDIGSTSKQFTAASILMLATAGKLKLDDDIRKYLPELPALTKSPVTIRHLLHHTGGVRDYTVLMSLAGHRIADVTTVGETLAMLGRQKAVEFEPGTKYVYSNTGYFLLAQIAERASKQSLADLVRDRIFKPLGMTRSIVLDNHKRIVPGRSIGYATDKQGWKLEMSQWEQTGDGSVLTTVNDLAKWDANFYDPKVGGAALVDALQDRGKTADGKQLDYAAGLVHGTYRGQATVSHGGAWAGYRSQFLRFPKLKTSVIVLCNATTAHPDGHAREIADIVLEKQLAPEPAAPKPGAAPATVKLSTAELDVWVGKYRDVASGGIVTVSRAGDTLSVEASGEAYPLVPVTKTTFKVGPTSIIAAFGGTAPKRTIAVSGGVDENYVELATYKPTAADLASYAGRYWSAELAVEWRLAIKNGSVIAIGRALDDSALDPTGKDELASVEAGVAIKLVRGPKGITGFVMNAGSVQGLKFDRVP